MKRWIWPKPITTAAERIPSGYVDLEARVANKRKLEERILGLLENQTGELRRVPGNIRPGRRIQE